MIQTKVLSPETKQYLMKVGSALDYIGNRLKEMADPDYQDLALKITQDTWQKEWHWHMLEIFIDGLSRTSFLLSSEHDNDQVYLQVGVLLQMLHQAMLGNDNWRPWNLEKFLTEQNESDDGYFERINENDED